MEEDGVMARSFGRVRELFVDESRAESAKREAEALRGLEINVVDMQWLQVREKIVLRAWHQVLQDNVTYVIIN